MQRLLAADIEWLCEGCCLPVHRACLVACDFCRLELCKQCVRIHRRVGCLFDGWSIFETRRANHCRSSHGSQAMLASIAGDFQVCVKIPSGRSVLLMVKGTDGPLFIQSRMRDLEGIPREVQSLTFRGRRFGCADTLSSLEIAEDDTIFLDLFPNAHTRPNIQRPSGNSSLIDLVGRGKKR